MSESTAGYTRESAPGRLLGCGRDTDVYDIGDGKVLRRYRVDFDHSAEIGAMKHLHEHGFPVPRLFSADGPDMVVERVDGPTMLDALVRYPWRARRYGRMLAHLHRRLHAIAPPAELRTAGTPREAVLHHAFRAAAHVDPAPYLAEACRVRLNDPHAKPVELQRLRVTLAKLERA